MSFSAQVKHELCRRELGRRCCAQAEACGVLLYCHTFHCREVRVVTGSPDVKERLPQLFKKAFRLSFDEAPPPGGGKGAFVIRDRDKLSRIFETFGYEMTSASLHVNFAVVEEDHCRQALFRGAFLAGGSVTDPQKGYHLELATPHYHVGRELPALLRECGFEPKEATRKSNYVTYFKHSDHIEDFLTAIGAPVCAMEIMNSKLEREMRGSVNRKVNCDSANLDKTVEAAQRQIEAIRGLKEQGRLASLPDALRETARLRLDCPELTLTQLAGQFDPPISKSALNHRLRKLMEIAGLQK